MKETRKHRITLHVDMDSFYSSVEVRERPELKGVPVVVGSDPRDGSGRGVVSTCSYEAREFGIHSGMPISKAYKLCPEAIYLPVNMKLYKEVSGDIMQLIHIFADRFQQVSVDEAYLDIADGIDDYESAILLAEKIKAEVLRKHGITCSIGVAPNKVIAKIASDFNKPNGLTVVRPDEIEDFLHPLPISKIPGIGKKTQLMLKGMNIENVAQLAATDVQLLIARFGKFGVKMHQLANGIDDREVKERDVVKSISTEDTFDTDISDYEDIHNSILQLCEKVHSSVIKNRFRFRTVTVKVRYGDFRTYTRAKTLSAATNEIKAIQKISSELIEEFIGTGKFRLLGVGVTKLEKIDNRQTSLSDF
jgi:DNA polymerase IV (DinB-like DNA polymerase)